MAIGAVLIVLVAGCVLPDDDGFPAGLAIERVSVNSSGTEGDDESSYPSMSADGRYVAFASVVDLVSDDTNLVWDIFVRDRQSGAVQRVSVDASGNQGNSDSVNPSISADGRYVAFESDATNLVAGDGNAFKDIFVYDRQSGTIERVSVDSDGAEADGPSLRCSLSADGRYVAFMSGAADLVDDDTNPVYDIFVYDRQNDSIERVSVDSAGAQADDFSEIPTISADGRYVAFRSNATNLVAGDTNGTFDVFVHDRQSGTTERVSVDSSENQVGGMSGFVSLSADGRYVAFESFATTLVMGDGNGSQDIFVRDRQGGTTVRVSVDASGVEGDVASYSPWISADGRYVAFASEATNLVADDNNAARDIFVYDLQSGGIERVSVDSTGTEANGSSYIPSLSADGRYAAFTSSATNLVSGDANGENDVFVAPNG
ncbi:MAG: hypothetical protein A2064_00010 [Spirochaetes bacterium GWB1_66_5]|nr:MAG: hypothetical protein A2064_00010 [Spirochaetes bacterium GWB1_66_5]